MSLNGEKILDTMSDVDESLILAAEKTRKFKKLFLKIGAAAAAAAIAVTVGIKFIPKNGSWTPLSSDELPDLPSLNLENLVTGGMGFEGYLASDMEDMKKNMDIVNYNFNIREMPVYNCESANPDVDKMRARLREAAEYFGIDYDSMEIREYIADEQKIRETYEPLGATEEDIQHILRQSRMMSFISADEKNGDVRGISIDIDASLIVSVHLTHPEQDDEGYYSIEAGGIELPEEYKFTPDASRKEQEETGRYLLERFSGLIDMKDPVFVLKSPYGDSFAYAAFYEKGENDAESIANQSIKHVAFSATTDGRLSIIRIWEEYKHCEKIADYPISNLEQATELLKNGDYLSSVSYELTGDEEIGMVNLTYWSGSGHTCVMPFYRFLVKLPEGEFYNDTLGEGEYGAYYVPAVRTEYFENLDNPSISFNGAIISK